MINNRYPDFAEKVQARVGKAIRQQSNERADLLLKERAKSRQPLDDIEKQWKEIKRLASVSGVLHNEIEVYNAIYGGKVA